jgi:phosphoenolpyruvate-protein phosphotransferase
MAEQGKQNRTFQGKVLAPGMGRGPAFVYRSRLDRHGEFFDIDTSEIGRELERLNQAAERIAIDLEMLAKQMEEANGSTFGDVFRAHIAIMQDVGLWAEVKEEVESRQISAGTAVERVFDRWERRFRAMEDDCLRDKADDLRDLARRFVRTLAGAEGHALARMPDGSVLIAARLMPSDIPCLLRRNAAAIVVESGGTASHAALFARETGLPCVGGIIGITESVESGIITLVDADKGEVVLAPDPRRQQAFDRNRRRQVKAASQALSRAREPAVSKDGKRIRVLANIARREDTQLAMDNGADGIGLYRIEHIYMERQEPPDAEELFAALQDTLLPAKDLPVYVRLLDTGGDKQIPFLPQPSESNPALGCRGVRYLLQHPRLLQNQLDALLDLSQQFDLHIIIPMVTRLFDIRNVKQRLLERAARKEVKHIPPLGAMIETPAAALSAADIARDAEFLSFGTNDLTQYAFAVDRDNPFVERYYDDTHAVVFQLLDIASKATPDIPLSICGELAGYADSISRILSCGIESLSVAPPIIPACKEAVRRLSLPAHE